MNGKRTRSKNRETSRPNVAKSNMKRPKDSSSQEQSENFFSNKSVRETIESIVVAFILAFLFRTFEAEAFVIPTGSMAPTLQGRHKDLYCVECGHNYRASASDENPDNYPRPVAVIKCTCPMCGYVMDCQRRKNDNRHQRKERTYNGDRILVSKFSYQIGDPQRWDVIVFKYPGNAKMNYIKRLVGLPNERVHINHGDIFVGDRSNGEPKKLQIARKSPDKLRAILQLVHDNQCCAKRLLDGGWPARWSTEPVHGDMWSSEFNPVKKQSTRAKQSWTFNNTESADTHWIRYQHFMPYSKPIDVWDSLDKGKSLSSNAVRNIRPHHIGDFYAYNEVRTMQLQQRQFVINWVGDLALDAKIQVKNDTGYLLLELIEGGYAFRCEINIATGLASLSIDSDHEHFSDQNGRVDNKPRTAKTAVRGPGKYQIMFANVDNRLDLWVNNSYVSFDKPTTYEALENHEPKEEDLAPLRVGARSTSLIVDSLQVYRDVYYIATNYENKMRYGISNDDRGVTFDMDADQFFVLGDNSPASKDSRLWKEWSNDDRPHYVNRELLIGKALFIYWPHARTDIFPFCPNIPRMGFVH